VTGELKTYSKKSGSEKAPAPSQTNALDGSLVRARDERVSNQETKAPAIDEPRENGLETHWIGRIIDDRYQVMELLAEGGMGAVYRAKHLKLLKDVALKVIRPEFAGDGDIAARFAREAMATARFEHPHVASAIDFGTLPEGGAYLVIQLVRGHSLTTLLETDGRFLWTRAVEIGAQIADALSAAAAQGIVHRDLKPDNIIIERRDDGGDLVKILDFGIARQTRDSIPAPLAPKGAPRKQLTRDGAIVGTPGYMAPEQAMGERANFSADLYALGVVLWESISGQPLWDAEDLSGMVMRQLKEPIPSLRERFPEDDIPEELDQLLSQLMAVSPKARPAHAGIVRDTLRQLALGAATGLIFLKANLQEENAAALQPPSDGALRAATATPHPVIVPNFGTIPDGQAARRGRVHPVPAPFGTPPAATATLRELRNAATPVARPPAAASPIPVAVVLDSESAAMSSLQTAPTQLVSAPRIDQATLAPTDSSLTPTVAVQEVEQTVPASAADASSLKKKPGLLLYLFATTALFLIFVLSMLHVLVIRGEDPFQLGKALSNYVTDIPAVLWYAIQQAGGRLADPESFRSQEAPKLATVATRTKTTRPSKGAKEAASPRESDKTETASRIAPLPEMKGQATARSPGAEAALHLKSMLLKIPSELEKHADALVSSKQNRVRIKAANKILAYRPASQVPKYLIQLSRLRKAQSCSAQREVVMDLTEVADPRALPVLLQLSATRKVGCGPRKARDCLGCLRRDLVDAIEKLESR
jgi:serine/threonine protein kinase